MQRTFGRDTYVPTRHENHQEGRVAFDLHRHEGLSARRVVRLAFRDATGQFFVQTFDQEVPLVILEHLIAEARAGIPLP